MGDSISVPFRGSVEAGRQLQELSAELRRVGHDGLLRKMRRNIRGAASPVMADLRSAVMSVEVSSSRGGHARPDTSTGLRRRIAGAITTSVTARRVRILVSARRVGPYGAVLPKYLDGTLPGYRKWRTRVFGRDVWVTQQGQAWWFVTINGDVGIIEKSVIAAMDETARELKG